MSAPGSEHERLVAELDDLAVLAGYLQPLRLPAGVYPDVARRDKAGHRFIGDAKSSELPTCGATFRRLARYARYMTYDPNTSDVLALAVPGSSNAQAWNKLLVMIVRSSGRAVGAMSATRIDGSSLVLHVTMREAAVAAVPQTLGREWRLAVPPPGAVSAATAPMDWDMSPDDPPRARTGIQAPHLRTPLLHSRLTHNYKVALPSREIALDLVPDAAADPTWPRRSSVSEA